MSINQLAAGIRSALNDWNKLAAILFLIGFALLAVYVVGLNQYPAAHEAFHDLRHAAGFPCH